MPPDESEADTDGESHSTRGPVDGAALADFRDVLDRLEPLATGGLDDPVNPTVLRVRLADGVGAADDARLDVTWTTRDDYTVHYTDSAGRDLRWDLHPHDYPRPPEDRHFHPPPDASNDAREVEASCIRVSEVELVARAVHALWRRAYERGSLGGINVAEDPP